MGCILSKLRGILYKYRASQKLSININVMHCYYCRILDSKPMTKLFCKSCNKILFLHTETCLKILHCDSCTDKLITPLISK